MIEFFIISYIKLLTKVHTFTEALQRFGIDPNTTLLNMSEKYLTEKKQGQNGLAPGVFGTSIYTTHHIPAKITPELSEIQYCTISTAVKWKQ